MPLKVIQFTPQQSHFWREGCGTLGNTGVCGQIEPVGQRSSEMGGMPGKTYLPKVEVT